MKRYWFLANLDKGVEAETEEEAFEIAEQMIKDREYNLEIVDKEEIK